MHLAQLSGSPNRCTPETPPRLGKTPVKPAGRWTRLKRGCRNAIHAGLEAAGMASLYVRWRKVTGATLLGFHSVAEAPQAAWIDPRYRLDPRRFERQMRFLAARRTPVSLNHLVDAMEAGRDLPPRTVVVTLDDGYLDHLTVAGPILAKLGIPATFFIPTGCASRGENQWIDTLYSTLQHKTRHELVLEGSPPRHFDLARPAEARRASAALEVELGNASYPHRCELLRELDRQLCPRVRMPRLIMDWKEVRELRRLSPDFEIGGHSRNHIDLGSRPPEEVEADIAGCAEDLRGEVGDGPHHFCYPYERSGPESKEQVRRRGFRCGVGPGAASLITRSSDRFELPRVDPLLNGASFGFVTSGAYPDLSRSLMGRA
jgi:peptidoglycan/xylan/chitin deacetylase (PgdA/CDA1 family)